MARKYYREKESTLNKNVVNWLNTIEGCLAHKRSATVNNAGKPDVTGCLAGIRIELEGKIGDNKPTALQKAWLAKWRAVGAITGVYWSLADAQNIISKAAKARGIDLN